MKKGLLWIVTAAIAVAWMTGCATPNTSGISVGAGIDEDGEMRDDWLQVDNAKLAKQIAVGEPVISQTKNGLMKVTVPMTLLKSQSLIAQSKFAWFDADGAEIDPDTDPWRPLAIHGKETRIVQGVAPSAAATAFQLRVRAGERTRWIVK